MSWIQDLFGRIFPRREAQQEEDSPILGLTGKPLNPLYQPKLKRSDFDEADKELDDWMKSMGYRKYRTAENGLPRPKRRFLKKSERMEPGDHKTMAGVSRFKK